MILSIAAAAAATPARTFLRTPARDYSFAEAAADAEVAATRLAVPAHRPVALVAHAEATAIIDLLALLEREIPVVLLHPRWTAAERAARIAEVRPALVIDGPSVAAGPDDGPLARPHTAVIAYTSGSTGQPRGVELSHAALAAAATASAANLGWEDDDAWLLALPFAHVGGLSVITRCLLARRTVLLGADLTADATLMSVVPTTLARALDGPRPPHLRAVLVGGAACPPTLLDRARAAGWPVLATYGLTETCAQVATQAPGADSRDVGAPLPGVELRILRGQIQVRGPTVMSGYFDGPAVRGWLDTGDLGRLDADGHLHILGRARDIIITGGENVSPLEVEAALLADPHVAAACVLGLPDPTWGEIVAAALVPTGVPTRLALADLAPFKRPRRIVWLPELPTLPSGKPDRALLHQLLSANTAATSGGTATF